MDAWTELYLDNYGWIRIDATGQGDAADLTAEVHTPEAPGLDNANENIDDKIKASINYARWQYAVFVLFSFVILIISLIYWIMKKWTMPVFRPSQRRQDNLPFFQYFKQHFTRQGFPPKLSQTEWRFNPIPG